MGKTGFRQFQAIVVTWDDTSCLFGTDIETLHSKKHSMPVFSYEFTIYKITL